MRHPRAQPQHVIMKGHLIEIGDARHVNKDARVAHAALKFEDQVGAARDDPARVAIARE